MGCIKKYMFKNLDDNWASNDFYIWIHIDKICTRKKKLYLIHILKFMGWYTFDSPKIHKAWFDFRYGVCFHPQLLKFVIFYRWNSVLIHFDVCQGDHNHKWHILNTSCRDTLITVFLWCFNPEYSNILPIFDEEE